MNQRKWDFGPVKKGEDYQYIIGKQEDDMTHELDPTGYFLIRINKEKKLIEAAFCRKVNVISEHIVGKNAKEVVDTIVRMKTITNPRHISYLGRELQKAEIALKYDDFVYLQDSPLIRRKTRTKNASS